jgi:hypothetical protein
LFSSLTSANRTPKPEEVGDSHPKGEELKTINSIQLVELYLPGLNLLQEVPTGGAECFGRHSTTLWEPGGLILSVVNYNVECRGTLGLYAVGKERILGLSRNEPIEVRCGSCDFRFMLSAVSWKDAVWEWMRITFSSGLAHLSSRPDAPDILLELLYGSDKHSLGSLLPPMQQVDETLKPYLKPEMWECLQPRIPLWPHFGIAIGKMGHLDTPGGLLRWGVIAALLLKNLEIQFQDSIAQAAATASSASEFLHPKSRRYR